ALPICRRRRGRRCLPLRVDGRRPAEAETDMMVTLPKPGDEGYDEAQRVVRKKPTFNKKGEAMISFAYHAPIAHVLGTPCVYFNPKPRWHRYPLVHERN